jgi:uncharacterized protein YceH (UPF0502 family)
MKHEMELTPGECRVIGALIEKELTTPDQYPLSLNALKNACNQKSSRDPVMNLAEDEVQNILDDLRRKHLVLDRSGFGSRVPKFKQRFCNTEFGSLQFSDQERGIVCALLLRGPQTPGQLRTNTNRLCEFADVGEVDAALTGLMEHPDGPFVERLPREPGKRECRYRHLFGAPGDRQQDVVPPETAGSSPGQAVVSDREVRSPDRVEELERRVSDLEAEVARLRMMLGGNGSDD